MLVQRLDSSDIHISRNATWGMSDHIVPITFGTESGQMADKTKWISISDAILRYRLDTERLKVLISEGEIRCKIVGNQNQQEYFIEDSKLLSRLSSDKPGKITDPLKRIIENMGIAVVGGVVTAEIVANREREKSGSLVPDAGPPTIGGEGGGDILADDHWILGGGQRKHVVDKIASYYRRERSPHLTTFDNSVPIHSAFLSLTGEVGGRPNWSKKHLKTHIIRALDLFDEYTVGLGLIDEQLNGELLFLPRKDFSRQDRMVVDSDALVGLFARALSLAENLIYFSAENVSAEEQVLSALLWNIFVDRITFEAARGPIPV